MVVALAAVWVVLWWLAIAVFVFTIVPAVVVIANGIISHARQIKEYADDVAEHAAAIAANVEPVGELVRTRDLVRDIRAAVSEPAESGERGGS